MRLRHAVSLLALALACGMAAASGLQVSPVSLSLPATQNADGLWLSNTGDNVVHAQVRVYHWTQENGEDKLTPTRNLLVSPPMLQLEAADRQLIRAIRIGAPPTGPDAVEDAYRVIIDELPVDMQGKKGLQFVLRYSVPIFIEAAGQTAGAPQLKWTLYRDEGQTILEVVNSGSTHAQLANLSYVDAAGQRVEAHPGLLGYVLPGARMRWSLKSPPPALAVGSPFEAMINGNTEQPTVSLADRAR